MWVHRDCSPKEGETCDEGEEANGRQVSALVSTVEMEDLSTDKVYEVSHIEAMEMASGVRYDRTGLRSSELVYPTSNPVCSSRRIVNIIGTNDRCSTILSGLARPTRFACNCSSMQYYETNQALPVGYGLALPGGKKIQFYLELLIFFATELSVTLPHCGDCANDNWKTLDFLLFCSATEALDLRSATESLDLRSATRSTTEALDLRSATRSDTERLNLRSVTAAKELELNLHTGADELNLDTATEELALHTGAQELNLC
eukprot:g55066.t1